jgi:hypothetical protein
MSSQAQCPLLVFCVDLQRNAETKTAAAELDNLLSANGLLPSTPRGTSAVHWRALRAEHVLHVELAHVQFIIYQQSGEYATKLI